MFDVEMYDVDMFVVNMLTCACNLIITEKFLCCFLLYSIRLATKFPLFYILHFLHCIILL